MNNKFILTPFFLDRTLPGLESLAQPGWEVIDPPISEGEPQLRMAELYENLADRVSYAVGCGERPVSIAGDCCTSLGVLAGLQRAGLDPFLIWFDAHGDFNTWETSPSGFLGGMPLAMLVGRGEQTIVDSLGMRPLPERQVILTDARDLDPGEREAVEESQLTHLKDVTGLLDYRLPQAPIWVHFDTDVVDSQESPAMNYPVPGGPSAVELQLVFQHLSATGRVVAVSLSSWTPELDEERKSEKVSLALLMDLISDYTVY